MMLFFLGFLKFGEDVERLGYGIHDGRPALFKASAYGGIKLRMIYGCCWLPDPFRGMGAWRKTMEPQKPGNSTGSGPEVVKRQRVAKE